MALLFLFFQKFLIEGLWLEGSKGDDMVSVEFTSVHGMKTV